MKDKLAGFIVKRRKAVLIFMVVLTTVVSLLMLGVHVNTDMTKYLPDGSSMKAGVELMEAEVPDAVSTHTLRVMVSGLDDEERASLTGKLGELEGVAAVTHAAGDAAYNQDDKALYVVAMDYDYRSTGRTLQKLRRERKLTQEVLSGLAGISRSHLAEIETGRTQANVETLWKLCAALGLPLSELFRRVEQAHDPETRNSQ